MHTYIFFILLIETIIENKFDPETRQTIAGIETSETKKNHFNKEFDNRRNLQRMSLEVGQGKKPPHRIIDYP